MGNNQWVAATHPKKIQIWPKDSANWEWGMKSISPSFSHIFRVRKKIGIGNRWHSKHPRVESHAEPTQRLEACVPYGRLNQLWIFGSSKPKPKMEPENGSQWPFPHVSTRKIIFWTAFSLCRCRFFVVNTAPLTAAARSPKRGTSPCTAASSPHPAWRWVMGDTWCHNLRHLNIEQK